MWNDETDNGLLVLQQLLDLVNGIQPLGLALDIFGLVLVIIVLLAYKQFLLEALLGLLLSTLYASTSHLVGSALGLIFCLPTSLRLARLLSVALFHVPTDI